MTHVTTSRLGVALWASKVLRADIGNLERGPQLAVGQTIDAGSSTYTFDRCLPTPPASPSHMQS